MYWYVWILPVATVPVFVPNNLVPFRKEREGETSSTNFTLRGAYSLVLLFPLYSFLLFGLFLILYLLRSF